MRGIRYWLGALLVCLGALPWSVQAQSAPVRVVASFSILGDFVQQVGGDRVALTVLAGPGQDAHAYEPRPADVALVAQADLLVVNGLHFEGFMERLIKAGSAQAPVAVLSDGAELLPVSASPGHGSHAHGHHSGPDHAAQLIDPHAWQAVDNAGVYVRNLAQALCQVDAEGCQAYQQRAQAYLDQLRALDTQLRQTLALLGPNQRTLLTAHDAFRYFGHAYDLVFVAPVGASSEAEPTAAGMRRLIQQLRQQAIAGVFLEHNTNPRLIRQLALETGMTVGGTLYADTLSAADGPAASYTAMMLHNAHTIVAGIAHPQP